jgi:hypothetical protein
MNIRIITMFSAIFAISAQAQAASPKQGMIDRQKSIVENAIGADKAAQPLFEERPAATVKNMHPAIKGNTKHFLIFHQKQEAHKAARESALAYPEIEARPAITVRNASAPAGDS